MYYFIAIMAYLITLDYIQGGNLGLSLGVTTKEAASALYVVCQYADYSDKED